MPAITTVHESLPYIDPEPTPAERAAAEALITAERATVPDDPHHALLPPAPPSLTHGLTPLLAAEVERAARGEKLQALDLSRYEAEDDDEDDSNSNEDGDAARLEAAVARARAAHEYVAGRRAHLALLDSEVGRNAWLVGNWQTETVVLAPLERELAATKRAVDMVAVQRRTAQDQVAGELRGLEEAWKRGVSRVLETEAATEGLRREILEARRRLE